MFKNKHILGIGVLLLISSIANAAAPNVTYVSAFQRSGTKLVDIWYGVSDADGDDQDISLQINVDGNPIPASSVNGDIGVVSPSNNLHIVWDADADWNKNYTNTVTFVITADNPTPSTVISNMVFVPSGTNAGIDPSYGQYSIVNTNAFYMDKFETINDEMVDVMQWAYEQGKLIVSATSVQNAEGDTQELLDLDDGQCRITWDGTNFAMKATYSTNYPCIEVTWYGAVAFCNYRSEKAGLTPCYNLSDWSVNTDANGYRLPLSSEREYAARGGASGLRFPWGNEINHDYANYVANGSSFTYDTSPYTNDTLHPDYYNGDPNIGTSMGTSPVDAFELGKNGYGLYDMAGNCWEWCYEWYPGYENKERIRRGGCWRCIAAACRCGNVYRLDPPHSAHHVSFRTLLLAGVTASNESSAITVDTRGDSRTIFLSGDLTFSNTVVGNKAQRYLTIHNNGDGAMQVTSIVYPPAFSGYWTGLIAGGESTNILVTFSPTAETNYTGTLEVISNATSGDNSYELSGTVIPPTINDFDADGKSDIAVFRPSSQRWYVKFSSGGNLKNKKFGIAGDIPMPADYNGDGQADFAVFRPSTGWWYGLLSDHNYLRQKWGVPNDIAVPSDFDGDGAHDLAVFRPSKSRWYVNGTMSGKIEQKWGIAGDIPVLGDFDGDGATDLAIFRNGGWWAIRPSSTGVGKKIKWGIAGDIPVPGDYDGDRITDLAIFRPSTQRWIINLSTGKPRIDKKWGVAGDIPIPADYDGDGITDVCIYRPSSQHWVISRSSDGVTTKTKWGVAGDEPVSVQYQIFRQMQQIRLIP